MIDINEQRERGKRARERVRRSAHKAIGDVGRDPVELLQEDSRGRVKALIPLRYGRMAASPFTFFRGSAILQAHDLGSMPDTDMRMTICGDAHLMNFGGFATPERQLAFDLNDFDEAASGPWEWDVKRLGASLVVAAKHMGYQSSVAAGLVNTMVSQYRDRMVEYAERGVLDLWYERITFDTMLEVTLSPEGRRLIRKAMEKAATRTHESMLSKMARKVGDHWLINDAPPALFHPDGPNSLLGNDSAWSDTDVWRDQLTKSYEAYQHTIAPDKRELLRQFVLQDIVFKVVGVGSVGTYCLVALFVDTHGKPLFLQIKQAKQSVVARYASQPPYAHEGERVVRGQRLLQAASDIFLGWASGPEGRQFYFRQLRDMKLAANVEMFEPAVLEGYARMCGWVLARAHAKASGGAIEIASYLGKGEQFAEALVTYSFAYAEQNNKDYDAFIAACRSGRIEARTDEDMAADSAI